MITDAELRALLTDAGFAARAEEAIARTVEEVWITTTRRNDFELGQSRIGGAPDLPRDTPWPRQRWLKSEVASWPAWSQAEIPEAIAQGTVIEEGDHIALALPFIAQLDLAELAPLQTALPRSGWLWLFADQQTTLGEIEHTRYCATACLYAAADAELVPAIPPPTPESLPGLALAFARGRVIPHANDLDLRDDDWNRYEKFRKPLCQPEPTHALMPVVFRGVGSDYPPAGHAGILRVDSDYTLDEVINWGDAAWITFAIPPAALAAHAFDELRAFRFCG